MTVDDYFADRNQARVLFDAVIAMASKLGPFGTRVTKSQIALKRSRDFAWLWCPDRYLHGQDLAPLVLSLSLPDPDPSPRWKEIVEPSHMRFMHHLELRNLSDVDHDVRRWLSAAYAFAA
jgi:hypothetical protein